MSGLHLPVRTLLALLVLAAGQATGQAYPNKPIRLITSAAGGSSDIYARMVAQGTTDGLGQPIIVDNRTNLLAVEAVHKAPPDGYTLLLSTETMWIRALLDKVNYDPISDFAPIQQVVKEVNVLAIHPSLPAKSVKELIALAKAKPGQLNYGSGARASGSQLAGALFASMANINIVSVAYKGSGQSVTALMAGEVQLMFPSPPQVMSHVKTGRLRILGVTSAEPSALVPGVPTITASGVPGYEAISMAGVFAPAKTPAAVINRMHQELARFTARQDVKDKFFNSGVEVAGGTPQQFAAAIKGDITRLGKVIKEAGIKTD